MASYVTGRLCWSTAVRTSIFTSGFAGDANQVYFSDSITEDVISDCNDKPLGGMPPLGLL